MIPKKIAAMTRTPTPIPTAMGIAHLCWLTICTIRCTINAANPVARTTTNNSPLMPGILPAVSWVLEGRTSPSHTFPPDRDFRRIVGLDVSVRACRKADRVCHG